ncbi:MAG: hypothetical protein P8R04_00355, partial [Gammaproteobacteria bacterium]|nr:hypothetical protein [Gammaproteobacteria bacterium]
MKHIILIIALGLLLAGCEPNNDKAGESEAAAQIDQIAFGGRLFDMWYKEIETDFAPDNPATPIADGKGGPNGDGTLNNSAGLPLLNSGHGYRLKNLFGWDMRGDDGIYGHEYQAKEFILQSGPLSPEYADMTRAEWIQRIAGGDVSLPAYSDVLNPQQIEALVDYMLAVRDRQLPHPDDLYTLSVDSPKGFVIAPGGDAARGHKFYQAQCAECHGDDATKIIFDNGEQTLGMHARYYGYAIAMIT